jgi:hypothetical protein
MMEEKKWQCEHQREREIERLTVNSTLRERNRGDHFIPYGKEEEEEEEKSRSVSNTRL